jgi:hypothetical protein
MRLDWAGLDSIGFALCLDGEGEMGAVSLVNRPPSLPIAICRFPSLHRASAVPSSLSFSLLLGLQLYILLPPSKTTACSSSGVASWSTSSPLALDISQIHLACTPVPPQRPSIRLAPGPSCVFQSVSTPHAARIQIAGPLVRRRSLDPSCCCTDT